MNKDIDYKKIMKLEISMYEVDSRKYALINDELYLSVNDVQIMLKELKNEN